MLLRSSSSPILKSLIPNPQPTLSPDPNLGVRIQAARRKTVSMKKNLVNMPRNSSETDMRRGVLKKQTSLNLSASLMVPPVLVEEKEEEDVQEEKAERVSFLGRSNVGLTDKEFNGGGDGGFGGGIFRKGGGDEGGDGDNSGGGSGNLDVYYQKMIKVYPNDALLLGNYAKYLKEIRGDGMKAEEYCERAILAKTCDVDLLSMYGDLIWNNHKDASRAQSYFDKALHYAPNDCYVLATYARFLGDAGEDEDVEEHLCANDYEPRMDFAKGCPSTIAATS